MSSASEENTKIRERLSSLETTLTFIQSLLKEIRDDVKGHPTKEDYDDLEELVEKVKKDLIEIKQKQTNQIIKVGITSGILGVIGGLLIRILLG